MAKPLSFSTKLPQFPPPSPPPISSSSSSLSFSLPPLSLYHQHHHKKPRKSSLKPISFSSNPKNGSTSECPVPQDQQPINEYQNLSTSFPFSWASGDVVEYSSRLFVTGLSFGLLVGLPVSWVGSVGREPDPVKLVLGSVSSGLFLVTLAVVRMYLGWAYVGNRLLSATVEYEETGWYDGQIWVKTAEVLARDRLLGSFQVKPVLSRLKNSLVALALTLSMCVSVFIKYDASHTEALKSSSSIGGDRVIAGVYNDVSARTFEPDAFCGEAGLVPE